MFVLGIEDVRAFMTVAFIHHAGYFGGVLGLIVTFLWLRRQAGHGIQGPMERPDPVSR